MITDITMETIRRFIYEKAAIVLDKDKGYLVEARLQPVARKHSGGLVDDLAQQLRKGCPAAIESDVIEALTTNETYFFRDEHPFDTLRDTLLPQLTAARPDRKLQIWCGAASTGQEPYSILMTLLEGVPAPSTWTFDILATDINHVVLERAKQGVYRQHEVDRGLPTALRSRYFVRRGEDWAVRDQLRQQVDFRILNLIDAWPFRGPFDVVFLRNVLIYFDVAAKKEILGRVRRLLAPDGVLFLGGAETTLNLDDAYTSVREGRTVFYKKTG